MPRSPIAFVVLLLVLLAASAARADFGFRSIQGTWEVTVTPQQVAGLPQPPPFQALFSFHFGGTMSETDGGIHPGSQVELFPDLGLLSASDGLGVWKRRGRRRNALGAAGPPGSALNARAATGPPFQLLGRARRRPSR